MLIGGDQRTDDDVDGKHCLGYCPVLQLQHCKTSLASKETSKMCLVDIFSVQNLNNGFQMSSKDCGTSEETSFIANVLANKYFTAPGFSVRIS